MNKEMFEHVLQKDEELIWMEGVNQKAFIVKDGLKNIGLFAFAGVFIAQFSVMAIAMTTRSIGMEFFLITWLLVLIIGTILGFVLANLNSRNTFFAITNKRIIKRSGAFNNKFIHYSLKNIGTIEVVGSIIDSKGPNASANLIITTKDFHSNTDGHRNPVKLIIKSLNNAYKAYNILSEKVDGNNENFRVKIEK